MPKPDSVRPVASIAYGSGSGRGLQGERVAVGNPGGSPLVSLWGQDVESRQVVSLLQRACLLVEGDV